MALGGAEVALIILGSIVGMVCVGLIVWRLYRRRRNSNKDLTAPLKDGEAKGKSKDPAMALLYKQVKELQHFQDKTTPEHVRLIQQDLVNRKIFEQLNNQQKHINEIIASQDRILREQLQKIDVIERQEDCLIEKIDEFMKETITETSRAMQNETEYHHYKQRKLQQTLLAQAADRAAGLIDAVGVESQINELKLMFQKSQEERQSLVATLTQASTDLKRHTQLQTYALDQAAAEAGMPQSPASPDSSAAPQSPVHVSSVVIKHPTTTQQYPPLRPAGKAKPHPPVPPPGSTSGPYRIHLQAGDDESEMSSPRHGSPTAAQVSAGLPTVHSAAKSTSFVPMAIPAPAVRLKKKRQKETGASEAQGAKKRPDSTALTTDEWWNSIGQGGGPLRTRQSFEEKQAAAEQSLKRVAGDTGAGAGGGGEAGSGDQDDAMSATSLPPPPRKASFASLSVRSHSGKKQPSVMRTPFTSASPVYGDQDHLGGDSDDDLAFAAPPGKHSFVPSSLGA